MPVPGKNGGAVIINTQFLCWRLTLPLSLMPGNLLGWSSSTQLELLFSLMDVGLTVPPCQCTVIIQVFSSKNYSGEQGSLVCMREKQSILHFMTGKAVLIKHFDRREYFDRYTG